MAKVRTSVGTPPPAASCAVGCRADRQRKGTITRILFEDDGNGGGGGVRTALLNPFVRKAGVIVGSSEALAGRVP